MNKVCQNCKNQFTIEPEDFVFYEKIHVPAPTFCPECRMVRRMAWRNERALYKRKNDFSGEDIISVISSDKLYKIYDYHSWWSDNWDPMDYGTDYNFNKPFFEQFSDLLKRVPMIALSSGNSVRSEYAQHALDSKDCYLISAAFQNENVLYSNRTAQNNNLVDSYLVDHMELSYEAINCGASYRLFFSYGCENCIDSWFLYDCRNCSNCFGCVGLRNKSYYVFNSPHTKDSYEKFFREFNSGSYKAVEEIKRKHKELILKFPRKYIYSFKKTNNVIGDIIGEAKNCYKCFDVVSVEDCKFVVWGGMTMRDTYDGYGLGAKAELLYEVVDTGIGGSRSKFSIVVWGSHDIQYSYNCHGSANLFGCIGLRTKSYCILNKQYSKEEYEELAPKIIKHMNDMPYIDKKGRVYRYGEFFPLELSPFAYNETIAQEYFPLTREQAIEKGYRWKDSETRNYKITLKTEQIPDHIKDVDDSIINKIIQCQHQGECNEQCATAFKIIKPELEFYRKMNLPLPRLCPNCRHYQRIKQRNPLKLWHRQCQCAGTQSDNKVYQNTIQHFHSNEHCPNEFETTYSPDRKEIVYCEKCYQQEVV